MAGGHHEVFSRFPRWTGMVEAGFFADFLGIKTRTSFYSGYPPPPPAGVQTPDLPPFDEEYFEWIDVLEAVERAADPFVMVEVGAGWGRWMVRAAGAARRLGRPAACLFAAVEAEPTHFRWMHTHFGDNAVSQAGCRFWQAACAGHDGEVWFNSGRAADSYGQDIAAKPTWREWWRELFSSGRRRRVPAVSLNTVLEFHHRIDLLDMDVQGAELCALQPAAERLDRRVRRVHVGTHNGYVEDGLRAIFRRMKWESVFDYPCHSTCQTPYGSITFQDGLQSWINPKLT